MQKTRENMQNDETIWLFIKISVILITVILLVASSVAVFNIHSGDSQTDLLPDDSYVRSFLSTEATYFPGLAYRLDVIYKTFDYSDEANQDAMIQLWNDIKGSDVINNVGPLWIQDYFL